MLIGKNKTNDLRYLATLIKDRKFIMDNKKDFICPTCKNEICYVDAELRIKHFKHKVKSNCNPEPETEQHINMKMFMYKKLKLNKDNLEYNLGFAIADLYIPEIKVAIEVQHSNINQKEFIRRTENYTKNEIYVLWVFHHKLMTEDSISAMLKEAHKLFLGRVYVYYPRVEEDDEEISPVHMVAKERWIEGYENDYTGESYGGYSSVYKNRRYLLEGETIKNFSLLKIDNPFNKLKIARFYDKRFWEVKVWQKLR